MKTVKRISGLLRVIGVVLVLVSIALWLYSLANTGGSWNTLKTALNNAGVQTGFLDRIRFDSRYFGAVPRRNLIGRAWFVFYPFSRRIGRVDRCGPVDEPTGNPGVSAFPVMARQ